MSQVLIKDKINKFLSAKVNYIIISGKINLYSQINLANPK